MNMNDKISDLISFALPRGWELDRYDYSNTEDDRNELYSIILPEGREALDKITGSIEPEPNPYPTQYSASPTWSSDDNPAGIAVFSNIVSYSNLEMELATKMLAQDGPLPTEWVTNPRQNYSLFSCWYWNESFNWLKESEAPPVFAPDADPAIVEAFLEMKAYLQQLKQKHDAQPALRFEVQDAYSISVNEHRAAVVECFERSERQLRKRTGLHLILDQIRENDRWLAAELHIFLHCDTRNEVLVKPAFRQFLKSLSWSE